MTTRETMDATAVVCPACGDRSGDCWEWVGEHPETFDCENEACGAKYECWAEVDVTYHAKLVGTT